MTAAAEVVTADRTALIVVTATLTGLCGFGMLYLAFTREFRPRPATSQQQPDQTPAGNAVPPPPAIHPDSTDDFARWTTPQSHDRWWDNMPAETADPTGKHRCDEPEPQPEPEPAENPVLDQPTQVLRTIGSPPARVIGYAKRPQAWDVDIKVINDYLRGNFEAAANREDTDRLPHPDAVDAARGGAA